MSQKSPSPARYLVHRQGTVDNLITQGHNALECAPYSPYTTDWRHLLERLEVLTLNTTPNSKLTVETHNADSGFPLEALPEDSVPRRYVLATLVVHVAHGLTLNGRILRETVSYLRTKDSIAHATRDVELAKYKSLVSQVDKHCRVCGLLLPYYQSNSCRNQCFLLLRLARARQPSRPTKVRRHLSRCQPGIRTFQVPVSSKCVSS